MRTDEIPVILLLVIPTCSHIEPTLTNVGWTKYIVVSLSAVLHGNNLLVFGGTGIPFGENNGNDVHVCNVQYKRWNLLNCRGKKPNKIYGQVNSFSFCLVLVFTAC